MGILLKIDKYVPIPEGLTPGNRKYPFKLMDVGDSFLIAGKTMKEVSGLCRTRKQRDGRTYRACVESDGVRVWRIA